MGGAAQAASAMKYHYFHGRFTYSVKRSGRSSGRGPLAFPSAASRLILVLKREPSREVGCEAEPVLAQRWGRFIAILPFTSAGRAEPVTSGNLFGGAIRAEDIAGWGV